MKCVERRMRLMIIGTSGCNVCGYKLICETGVCWLNIAYIYAAVGAEWMSKCACRDKYNMLKSWTRTRSHIIEYICICCSFFDMSALDFNPYTYIPIYDVQDIHRRTRPTNVCILLNNIFFTRATQREGVVIMQIFFAHPLN